MGKVIEFRPKTQGDAMEKAKENICMNDFIAAVEGLTFGEACSVYNAIEKTKAMNKEDPDAYKVPRYKKGAIMYGIATENRERLQDNRPANIFKGLALHMWNKLKELEFNQVMSITGATKQLLQETGHNRAIYAIKI